jgi:hypothetical protein
MHGAVHVKSIPPVQRTTKSTPPKASSSIRPFKSRVGDAIYGAKKQQALVQTPTAGKRPIDPNTGYRIRIPKTQVNGAATGNAERVADNRTLQEMVTDLTAEGRSADDLLDLATSLLPNDDKRKLQRDIAELNAMFKVVFHCPGELPEGGLPEFHKRAMPLSHHFGKEQWKALARAAKDHDAQAYGVILDEVSFRLAKKVKQLT